MHNCRAASFITARAFHERAEEPSRAAPWKEREEGRSLRTAGFTHGPAAVPTLRWLLGWTFPIATRWWGQGVGVASSSSPSQDPAALGPGEPRGPLLPWGSPGTQLLARSRASSGVTVNITVLALYRRRDLFREGINRGVCISCESTAPSPSSQGLAPLLHPIALP